MFTCGKKQLGKIIDKLHPRTRLHTLPPRCSTHIKAMGYKYSTKGALTVSVARYDSCRRTRTTMIAEAEKKVAKIDQQVQARLYHRRGALPTDRHQESGKRPPRRLPQRCRTTLEQRYNPIQDDGGFRCPRFYQPDPSAGRYARPDGHPPPVRPSRSRSSPTSVKV